MSANFYNLLKYAATGQASPDMTYYDRMRSSTLMGGVMQTLTGQPPLSFKSDGKPLTAWSIYGNGQQTGTPSPQSIIMPTFCGARTANLFDKSATDTNNGYIGDGYLKSDGSKSENANYRASEYIPINPNQAYTLFYGTILNNPSVCFYDSAKNFISGVAYSGRSNVPFTTPQGAAFLRLSFRELDKDAIMLNLGSTALPYEPYGWAEKITCGGQTVPVYLGEVPTVRRVRKLVLTGEEFWRDYSGNIWSNAVDSDSMQGTTCVCTHLVSQRNRGIYISNGSTRLKVYASSVSSVATTAEEWVQYLQQQYAAGTPVTVWYVLATPETGIVNEPLAKIGDYADELSSADAGVTIPTAKGENTISFDTAIQPSKVSITGHIKE